MAKKSCDNVPMLVVTILGAYGLIALVGMIYLILNKAGEGSVALVATTGGGAIGAISGILSKTDRSDQGQNPPPSP